MPMSRSVKYSGSPANTSKPPPAPAIRTDFAPCSASRMERFSGMMSFREGQRPFGISVKTIDPCAIIVSVRES